jgi:hypothetical protein
MLASVFMSVNSPRLVGVDVGAAEVVRDALLDALEEPDADLVAEPPVPLADARVDRLVADEVAGAGPGWLQPVASAAAGRRAWYQITPAAVSNSTSTMTTGQRFRRR